MKRSARSAGKVVCLSAHPLVLSELMRFLGRVGLRVLGRQLEIAAHADVRSVPLPPAVVYIVDGQSTGPATEVLIASIRNRRARARVIALLDDLSDRKTFPLLRLGVKGVILYAEVPNQLARATKSVARGGVWVPRAVMSHYLERVQSGIRSQKPSTNGRHLSLREREVLRLLLKNLVNKEIASMLNISERTVKFHVSNILSRFGVQRRSDLLLQSIQESTFVER